MMNLLHTVFMGMKTQSSPETRKRAKDLSEAIGSYHLEADIDQMFNACKDIGQESTGFKANFEVHGGTSVENLALQSIQSRSRMVLAYYHAQMLPLS
jgi:NAD+ synthase (glutamine-hydrolysing)